MNYYEILGVSKDATEDDIKKAWRRLASAHHPDRHTDEGDKADATAAFQKLQQAYDTLSDPEKRNNYDTYGTSEVDVREQVKMTVLNEFNILVQSHGDLRWVSNLFDAISVNLRANLTKNESEVRKAEKDISRMHGLAKRIQVKPGKEDVPNVFQDLINQRIKTAENFIKTAALTKLVIEASIEFLSNFDDPGVGLDDALDSLFAGTTSNTQFRIR